MSGPKTNSDNYTIRAERTYDLDGFMRLKDIIAPRGPIPVGKSTWWTRVKDGTFPQPYKLGPGITAWRRRDIHDLIERMSTAVSQSRQTRARRKAVHGGRQ
jgi:predicted DNA-binding transcriptional regulator AlpA